MTWQHGSMNCRNLERMFTGSVSIGLAVCVFAVLGPAMPVMAQTNFWSGEGSDNLWTTPENWSKNVEPTSGNVWVNGPEAAGNRGPLIEDGIDATVTNLFSDSGRPVMTMTGGTLSIATDLSWGEITGTDAVFRLSGGTVDVGRKIRLGWQSLLDPPATANGEIEMTGGVITANSLDMGGGDGRGKGIINLFGGTINVDTGGLLMYSRRQSQIDITEGILNVAGDVTAQIQSYIDDNMIRAYGGDGMVDVMFAGGTTTVTGIDPNPAIPGDYNENGELDSGDLDLQSEAIQSQDLAFDLIIDGVVDFKDREEWVHNLKKTWIGDSNLDGTFGSGDLVLVFSGGKFELDELATWEQGDWNGDMRFGSGDLVTAFSDGGFEVGPRAAAAAVPEPASIVLCALGFIALIASRRRR